MTAPTLAEPAIALLVGWMVEPPKSTIRGGGEEAEGGSLGLSVCLPPPARTDSTGPISEIVHSLNLPSFAPPSRPCRMAVSPSASSPSPASSDSSMPQPQPADARSVDSKLEDRFHVRMSHSCQVRSTRSPSPLCGTAICDIFRSIFNADQLAPKAEAFGPYFDGGYVKCQIKLTSVMTNDLRFLPTRYWIEPLTGHYGKA